MSSLSHFLDSAVNNVKAAIDEMRTNGHCYVPIKLQTHTLSHSHKRVVGGPWPIRCQPWLKKDDLSYKTKKV